MKRKLLISAVALLVVAGGAFVVIEVIPAIRLGVEMRLHAREAIRREPQVMAAWKREFGDPAALLARYPKEPDDQTVLRLMELGPRLEIPFDRPKAGRRDDLLRPGEAPPPRDTSSQIHKAIGDYVNAQLQAASGPIDGPPPPVAGYLQSNRGGLDEIISILAKSPRPRWETDVSKGSDAPVPNLLAPLRLQRALIARALEAARTGADAEAGQTLLASWNLNAGLRDRPDVISQIVAVGAARMQVGLLRKIRVEPQEWIRRLHEHDYRSSMLAAMEVEAIAGLNVLTKKGTSFDRASRVDYLDRQTHFLVTLRDSPISDKPKGEELEKAARNAEPLSAGDILSILATSPNLSEALRREDRLVVDTELTEKILEARTLRSKLGDWPREMPGIEKSRLRDAHWIYSVTPEGQMSIALSRSLDWGSTSGLVLPVRYEASR